MNVQTLWLVRHGHTLAHEAGTIAGRHDVALSEQGCRSIEVLGVSLREVLDRAAVNVHWVASPMQRTFKTACLLRAALGDDGQARLAAGREVSAVETDQRLVELDFGDWEGLTWDAVHRDQAGALAAWGEDWVHHGPPHGESFESQFARCRHWATEVLSANTGAGAELEHARNLIVVAHGGSIRALLCHLLGKSPAHAMRFAIDLASVSRLERDDSRASGWRLVLANASGFD